MHGVRLTWANLLTLLRVALIPHVCYALSAAAWNTALSIFAVAAATDAADGWCARWLNEETQLGQYLDPIADKALMLSCYSVFTFGVSPQIIPVWFFYGMLTKEAVFLFTGVYLWTRSCYKALTPAHVGKFAMGLQVASVSWILWALYSQYDAFAICMYCVWAIVIATISAFAYYTFRILQQSGVSL